MQNVTRKKQHAYQDFVTIAVATIDFTGIMVGRGEFLEQSVSVADAVLTRSNKTIEELV